MFINSIMFALLVLAATAAPFTALADPPTVPPASATAVAISALGERLQKLETKLVEGKCLKDHDQCQKTAESVKAEVGAKIIVSGGFTKKDRDMLADIQARVMKVEAELKKIGEKLDALAKKVDAVPDSVMKLANPRFDKLEKLIEDGLGVQGCAAQTQSLVIAKKANADAAAIANLAKAVAICIDKSSPTLDKVAKKCLNRGVECIMNTPAGPLIISAPEVAKSSGMWRIGTWGALPVAGFVIGFAAGGATNPARENEDGSFSYGTATKAGMLGLGGGLVLAGIIELGVALAK